MLSVEGESVRYYTQCMSVHGEGVVYIVLMVRV